MPHANHPQDHPHGHGGPPPLKDKDGTPQLRLVAWETTRRCNLSCMHCRAGAEDEVYPGELTTKEGEAFLDDLATMGSPVVILTGGEPLLRDDIFHLAKYGDNLGLRMVSAVNGTLLTKEIAQRFQDSGVKRLSISIDGPDAASHDKFRGQENAFDLAMEGMRAAKEVGLEFQINTTVTRTNLPDMEAIQELAVDLGAVAHHIFLLVPTGTGTGPDRGDHLGPGIRRCAALVRG